MSLLPDNASFFEKVQAFFLACRGDGVALSDKDARLLLSWESFGIPADIVILGIRKSLEKHVFEGKIVSRPRSLASCRKSVEAEIRRYLKLRPGSAVPDGENLPMERASSKAADASGRTSDADASLIPGETSEEPISRGRGGSRSDDGESGESDDGGRGAGNAGRFSAAGGSFR